MTRKNLLLSAVFRLAALMKVPKRRKARNFALNRVSDSAVSGCISGQRVGPAADFRYGLCRYGSVGCEVIAVYNALYLLGFRPSLAEIGRRFEACGGQMLLGAWGTDPFSIEKVLAGEGISLCRFESAAALSAMVEKGKGAVLVLSFWNQKGNIFKGIHTVTVEYNEGKYIAYNRFDTVPHALCYDSLEAVLGNGSLIVGYIVEANASQI